MVPKVFEPLKFYRIMIVRNKVDLVPLACEDGRGSSFLFLAQTTFSFLCLSVCWTYTVWRLKTTMANVKNIGLKNLRISVCFRKSEVSVERISVRHTLFAMQWRHISITIISLEFIPMSNDAFEVSVRHTMFAMQRRHISITIISLEFIPTSNDAFEVSVRHTMFAMQWRHISVTVISLEFIPMSKWRLWGFKLKSW